MKTSAVAEGFYPDLRMLIGGEWREGGGAGQDVINPATEEALARLPHASMKDLEDTVAAADSGFETWRKMSPADRADIMLAAARLMRKRAERIAPAVTAEQGKPLAQSRAELMRACEMLEWDAGEGRRLYGRIIPAEPGMRRMVWREPAGIAATFTPWNFPLTSPARKIGAALASGCSLILKPSEETPGAAVLMAEAFMDAGLPPGVLNVVFGDPATISTYLIEHPAVRTIAFTGSIAVGKRLAALAGANMKGALMELGGHGPVIICDDTDPRKAAAEAVIAKSRNAGQVCVSPTRFFVEAGVYEAFVDGFVGGAKVLRIGDGMLPETQMGPLANARRLEAMEGFVEDAGDRGARIAAGGKRLGNRGYFYPLTVIADANDDLKAMREEPFGPLALISPVDDLDEAIERANALPYGLAGYGYTSSAAKAERLSTGLECGNIAINHLTASVAETPFGGVKDSGIGREGGLEGLESYTTVKSVSHKTA